MCIGREHENVDGDKSVQGGEDVGLRVQNADQARRGESVKAFCQVDARPNAHRGMEKRSRRTNESVQLRDVSTPSFGGGRRPLRQTYSVLASTTGWDTRSSASTSG